MSLLSWDEVGSSEVTGRKLTVKLAEAADVANREPQSPSLGTMISERVLPRAVR